MGGPGSGSWYRWNKKIYAEEVNRIDIRYLKKQGMLRPGSQGSLWWTTNGEKTGDIRYATWGSSLQLIYRFRQYGDDWESVDEHVRFAETPCNFGGSRKWFICPSCQTRVGLLYGPGKYFRCRSCYGLSYASQNEGKLDRMTRKVRKIRKRLDIGNHDIFDPDSLMDDVYYKPRGMRWNTFERLKQAEIELQEQIDWMAFQRFGFLL
jgi:hypothetical protein